MRLLILITGLLTLVPAARSAEIVDTGAHTLRQIADGVFAAAPVYGGSNAMIVIDDDFVLVVDSHSSPAGAARLVDAIRELTDAPVRYVVWHVDHHSGNRAYRDVFPADVVFISHHTTREDIPTLGREQFVGAAAYRLNDVEAAEELLEEGLDSHGLPFDEAQRTALETYARDQAEFARDEEFEFTLADLTLTRRLTIHGKRHTIDILYFYPAHTRGDPLVWVPDARTVFTGDILFIDVVVHVRNAGALAVGDILTQPILWTWASFPSAYIRTLEALRQLGAEKTVIGHGGPVLDGDSFLLTALRFMEAVVAVSKKARNAGVDREKALDDAASDPDIEAARDEFAAANPEAADMFDQMLQWTFARAWEEHAAETAE